jgi:argininosuccinate lyase
MIPLNPVAQEAANLAWEGRAGIPARESPLDMGAAARVLEIGGRLRHGPSERLVQAVFRKELEAQLGLFDALSRADLAHTLMLVEAGVIPSEPGRELLAALLELHARPLDFQPDPARGDLYTNREAWLAARTSATGWLGAGRARREAITTAFLMRVREALLELAASLAAAGLALTARARQFRAALMADYTYLLAAQPTSFGHYLLGFVYPMLRDQERLRGLYGRIDQSPAGCGSTNGSRLPQDRARLAELLGFERLQVHARDAAWAADLPIEAMALLAAILVNLDRLAEDLQIFATEEFALVELDDCHARASKIMPQKKNPFALAHVRGLANAMTGALAAAVASGRTPSGQPDNRLALYGALPQAIDDTRDAVALMAEVAQCLAFREGQARARLVHSFAASTDLAETLTLECGLDFREAHRLVGQWVRAHLAEGGFGGLTPEELAQAAADMGQRVELSAAGLDDALDPLAALAARTSPGGAAAAPMAAMLEECERGFTEAANWADASRQGLAAADAALFAQVRAVVGG